MRVSQQLKDQDIFNKFEEICKDKKHYYWGQEIIINTYNKYFEQAYKISPKLVTQILNKFFIDDTASNNEKINMLELRTLSQKENLSDKEKKKIDTSLVTILSKLGEYSNSATFQSYRFFLDFNDEIEEYYDFLKKGMDGFRERTYWNMVADSYQRGFELIRKIMVYLICVDKILSREDVNFKAISEKNAFKLIEIMKKSERNWDVITFPLDRQIRNSASHLDFYYDSKIHIFWGKKIEKGKIERFMVYPDIVKNVLIPSSINVAQGFVASLYLFKLRANKNLHEKALKMIS